MDWDQVAIVLQWVGLAAIVIVIVLVVLAILRAFFRLFSRKQTTHPVLQKMQKPMELPGGKERIMVIDDDPTTLQVNSRILTSLGYEVICAKSGEEAVSNIKQIPVDLLVLDLVMDPGMNGVDALREIKKIRPRQRAIILSGYAQPSQVAEAQKLGASKYLIKPAPVGTLAAAVREELDR